MEIITQDTPSDEGKNLQLTKEEYDLRRTFLENLKNLSKEEKEDIFRIIKSSNTNYSENNNGIFFDVATIKSDVFQKLREHIVFCNMRNKEQDVRIKEMELLREDLHEDTDEKRNEQYS